MPDTDGRLLPMSGKTFKNVKAEQVEAERKKARDEALVHSIKSARGYGIQNL